MHPLHCEVALMASGLRAEWKFSSRMLDGAAPDGRQSCGQQWSCRFGPNTDYPGALFAWLTAVAEEQEIQERNACFFRFWHKERGWQALGRLQA